MEERISKSRISFQGKLIGGKSPSAFDVGVVVVTYNSERTIARCLELLLSSSVVARLVVVDNASADGTRKVLELFAKVNPEITLVFNADNRGFASACNQGASAL